MRNRIFAWLCTILFPVLGALALVAACVHDDDSSAERLGTAQIAFSTVPADVGCLRVRAAGAGTVDRSFDVATGQSQTLVLDWLPTGAVTFSAAAFRGACAFIPFAAEPAWVSDPVPTTVPRDAAAAVALTMHRADR